MPRKRMSQEKVAEIIKLLEEGKDVRQIASDYNISVATVYNYKTRSARQGIAIPKGKRGRKPKGMQFKEASNLKEEAFHKLPVSVKMESYHFIINGVKVTVSGKAQTVHIASDQMVINF